MRPYEDEARVVARGLDINVPVKARGIEGPPSRLVLKHIF